MGGHGGGHGRTWADMAAEHGLVSDLALRRERTTDGLTRHVTLVGHVPMPGPCRARSRAGHLDVLSVFSPDAHLALFAFLRMSRFFALDSFVFAAPSPEDPAAAPAPDGGGGCGGEDIMETSSRALNLGNLLLEGRTCLKHVCLQEHLNSARSGSQLMPTRLGRCG